MDSTLFFDIFRFSFFVGFLGLHVLLLLGVFLEWFRERKAFKTQDNYLPFVSLVIPVHNESQRIEGLLRSLETQDYSQVEIIFVDDRSEDESASMIGDFISRMKGKKIELITLKENPGVNRKQFALARGIEKSSGEFILFTDADCEMSPSWIGGMVKRLSDKSTGAVIAPVFKHPRGEKFYNGKKFLSLYQCFEHGIRYVYLAGSTGLGSPGGGFGNNLIFRRECLEIVGGYDKIPPSPTEDAALISAIRSSGKYKIRSALGKDVHVMTQGENSWKELINQTLRWNNGGLFSRDLLTRLNFSFLMITIGMGIVSVPLLSFIPSIWPLPLAVFISMSLNSIVNLSLFRASLPRHSFAFGLNLFFTPVYFTFLTILGFLGIRPDWKGKEVH